MLEKNIGFWIALAVAIFAVFASAMVLVQIVRLRRVERIAAQAAKKYVASLKLPPKQILE